MTEMYLVPVLLGILTFVILAFILLYHRSRNVYAPLRDGPKASPVEIVDGDESEAGRVEWVDGGEIMVCRTGGLFRRRHLFGIKSHMNEGSRSIAEVTGALCLSEGRRFTYYGVYPASACRTSRRNVKVSGDINRIQQLEQNPENRRMYKADTGKHGYLYAISPDRSSGAKENGLRFKPLFSSMVFKIHSPAENYMDNKMVSLRLTSAQDEAFLAGSFEATLDARTGTFSPVGRHDISGGSNAITVYFGHGIRLGKTPEEETVVQLLSLPMDHTMMTLSVRFDNGAVRNVKLAGDDGWITAGACRKTVFSNVAIPGKIQRKPGKDEPAGQRPAANIPKNEVPAIVEGDDVKDRCNK